MNEMKGKCMKTKTVSVMDCHKWTRHPPFGEKLLFLSRSVCLTMPLTESNFEGSQSLMLCNTPVEVQPRHYITLHMYFLG